jgi:hypothetical protein
MNPPAKHTPAAHRLHSSPAVRALLWVCGVAALFLAALGVVLPGLPTTPFVLVAGACFVRASPQAHAWLLRNRLFGPLLREWEEHRSVPRRIKVFALVSMLLLASVSVWFFAGRPWVQAAILGGMLVGAVVLGSIRSRR